ncbi:ASCH domain-containing protein [Kineococcus sp. DHX-1]|uniref:ASCH domain-containing protein n=1 Tax=Kineococcus sp. DHX-1 TaxID=3349638 RepID=UPI0036D28C2B
MTWPRVDGLRALGLGEPGPVRAELNALVLAGRKRATAGLLDADYRAEDEHLEVVGERLVLIDDDDQRLALVEVTDVRVVRFDEVTDDFARAEGEGFADREDWARAHRGFWQRSGNTVDGDTEVVCLRFAVVGGVAVP